MTTTQEGGSTSDVADDASDTLDLRQLRKGIQEIMAQENTGVSADSNGQAETPLRERLIATKNGDDSQETKGDDSRMTATRSSQKMTKAPVKRATLSRHNQEVIASLPRIKDVLGTDFYKDAVRQDAERFLRCMTLLVRFRQVFVGRSTEQITNRLIEEGDVKKLGGIAQVIEMGVQAGYLEPPKHAEVGAAKATPAARDLLSRAEPLVQVSDVLPNRELLEEQLLETYAKLRPTSKSETERQKVVRDVQRHLDREFRSVGFLVEVFGSSGNGLYFPGSDLDICAYYSTMPPVRIINIQLLGASLRRATWCTDVFTVAFAKIPVIKLVHAASGLKVDISIENTIAIENTRLIRLYMDLDERVKPLAIALKVWCKARAISHPEEGTLSSYSSTLMLIHFLQRTSPPVLPNLQAVGPDQEPFSHTYQGTVIDCYYDESPTFKSVNAERVGALFAGFFHYYARVFDMDRSVVNVAPTLDGDGVELDVLTKAAKGRADWANKRIAIQDPFIADRNTAVGCGEPLAEWIADELARAARLLDRGASFADLVGFGDR